MQRWLVQWGVKQQGGHYIVGARQGNIPSALLQEIDPSLPRQDWKIIRLKTHIGDLIRSFSSNPYRKDKYDMGKQLERAEHLIENPGKSRKIMSTKT